MGLAGDAAARRADDVLVWLDRDLRDRRCGRRRDFGACSSELAGADVVGVDWRIPLDEAARRVSAGAGGDGKAVQGNLDPAILLAGWDVVESRTRAILDRARSLNGHVFNLGHGVLPETSPATLARLADFVHEYSARTA